MSIIHFLLAIFMNCPPLMNFSNDHHQHMPTTPIRLTGGNSHSWQVNVAFNALQQCMPPYPGNNAMPMPTGSNSVCPEAPGIVMTGQQAYADDELLREAFLERVAHGARLKNYAGFWVLGMDMLPWTKQNKLELYINRSCTCTMEAWFIQPTDSVAQIVAPKVPKAGSTKCPALNTNNTFTVALVKDAAGQAIVIDALTDVHLTNIAVELAKADENNVTGGAALMNFSIGTTDDLKVFIADTGSYVIKDERLPNGSYKMRMEIILFDHFYAIKLNGAQLGGIFLSKHWFDGVEWEKVASIKASKFKLGGAGRFVDAGRLISAVDHNTLF
uniref:Uncharacterized protein n=1 Tax=Globodera rostochiensis TaxID=31243 RepID=A0A914HRM3_GLORO